ncbi:MAG: hypothetical protein LJE92_09760 [Gammaproteobacteria bacterium]|jgi:hypothetical protein|nr:hypothetical protein [Gammaproteobacteria bacterium]
MSRQAVSARVDLCRREDEIQAADDGRFLRISELPISQSSATCGNSGFTLRVAVKPGAELKFDDTAR